MEACPGSQRLARKLQAMGRQARIVPAQFVKPFVKPYVKPQKNDAIDAAAIAEAVARPTMRFAQARSAEQADPQALRRIRDQRVAGRTRAINQARAFRLECAIAIRQGAGAFRIDPPRALADETSDLAPALRRMPSDLFADALRRDERITGVAREIADIAARDDRARRLAAIPGIGPLAATALPAAVGDGRPFRRARDLAAWLGLTPRECATGGKTTLPGISKRGNRSVRRMLVHGARSCATRLDRTRGKPGDRLDALEERMPGDKVAIALADKIARIAWAILARAGALCERKEPARA